MRRSPVPVVPLGYFYTLVAGENAEKEILDQLLPNVYDKTIFTEEQEAFLKDHFQDMVNYIILIPCGDSLEWVHEYAYSMARSRVK